MLFKTADNASDSASDSGKLETAVGSEAGAFVLSGEEGLQRNAGFFRSFSSIICIIIGSGCLQIPYAFGKIGWIGVGVIVLSAFIGAYTGSLIVKCLYYKPGRRLHSFPDIGRHAFGVPGKLVTQAFNYMYSLGTTCLYVILAGQFIHQLVETRGVTLDKRVWIAIVSAVVWVPVALLKHMAEAAVLAVFGFLTSCVVIAVASIQSFRFPYSKLHPHDPPPAHSVAIAAGIPVALSSIVFSFAGTVVFPHVEGSMRSPKQWPRVLATAMLVCAVSYLLVGVAGYWAYGDLIKSPVLDSIPSGAPNTIAIVMVTIHVIIAAPIMLMSFYLEIENEWNINADAMGKHKELAVRLAYRSLTVACVCGISVAIPYFSDFLSLVSSLSTTVMFAVLPVVCYTKLYGFARIPWYERLWMCVVLAVGAVGCVWGTIDAVRALIKDVRG